MEGDTRQENKLGWRHTPRKQTWKATHAKKTNLEGDTHQETNLVGDTRHENTLGNATRQENKLEGNTRYENKLGRPQTPRKLTWKATHAMQRNLEGDTRHEN